MPRKILGLDCGLAFGIIHILIMIPLDFENKKAALIGTFINRFSIGFVIGATDIPLMTW